MEASATKVRNVFKAPATYFGILAISFVLWAKLRESPDGSELVSFLDRLQIVGSNPLTFVAFVLLIAGWMYSTYAVRRIETVFEGIKNLPEKQQLIALKELTRRNLAQIPPQDRIDVLRGDRRLVGYLATLACAITLGGLAAHVWTLSAQELGRANKTLETIVTQLEQEFFWKKQLDQANLRLSHQGGKINALSELIRNPPPPSHRAKAIAALITENDPPYARALKAIAEERYQDALRLLEEDRDHLMQDLQRNYRTTADAYYFQAQYESAKGWYKKATEIDPNDMASILGLASTFSHLGQLAEALPYYDAVIAAIDVPDANDKGMSATIAAASLFNDRGIVRFGLGELEDAITDFEESARLLESMKVSDDSNRSDLVGFRAGVLTNRAAASQVKGDLDQALTTATQVVDIFVSLIGSNNEIQSQHQHAMSLNNRGVIFLAKNEADRAMKDFEATREILKSLAEKMPSNPDVSYDLAIVDINIGNAYYDTSAFNSACTAYHDCLSQLSKLADYENSDRVNHLRGVCFVNRGRANVALRLTSDAETDYSNAVNIFKNAAISHTASGQVDIVLALDGRASVRMLIGAIDQACLDGSDAVHICKRLVEQELRIELRPLLALTQYNYGLYLRESGRLVEALNEFNDSIERYEELYQAGRQDLLAEFAGAVTNRGIILTLIGKLEDACADFSRCLSLCKEIPDDVSAQEISRVKAGCWSSFGIVLTMSGRAPDAIEAFSESIKIRDSLAMGEDIASMTEASDSRINRAVTFAILEKYEDALRDLDGAVQSLRRLVEREGRNVLRGNLGTALSLRGQVLSTLNKNGQAEASLDEAIRIYESILKGGSNLDIETRLAKTLDLRLAMMEDSKEAGGLRKKIETLAVPGRTKRPFGLLDVIFQAVTATNWLDPTQELITTNESVPGDRGLDFARKLSLEGQSLVKQGAYADAIPLLTEAGNIMKRARSQMQETNRVNIDLQLAVLLANRGKAYAVTDKLPLSVADWDEVVSIYERLVLQHESRQLKRDFALCITNRATVLGMVGRIDEMMSQYERAEVMFRELAQPETSLALCELATVIGNKGGARALKGDLEGSLKDITSVIVLYQHILEMGDDDGAAVQLALAYYNRALILFRLSRWDEAAPDAQIAETALVQRVSRPGYQYLREHLNIVKKLVVDIAAHRSHTSRLPLSSNLHFDVPQQNKLKVCCAVGSYWQAFPIEMKRRRRYSRQYAYLNSFNR